MDFDGTITEKDSLIAIMERFAPESWIELKDLTLSRQISVRKGVGEMFSLLGSSQKEEIIAFVKKQTIFRAGFLEFLHWCSEMQIEYKVLSGGIDFYIYPLLEKVIPRENILCNQGDFSGANIRINWNSPCDSYCHLDCGICKTSFIRRYDPSRFFRILLGDSVTDFGAATVADRVFARDALMAECQKIGIPAVPFNEFYDVIQTLRDDPSLF